MPTTFQYSVRDRAGKISSGTLDGESATAIAQRLKQMGYAPITITESAGKKKGLGGDLKLPGMSGEKKVKLKELTVFARQFATMINSGLSLLRALTILTDQTDSKKLRRVLGEIRNDVETGNSLSAAMGKHPDVFPPLMVNMCKAGEVGGFLDTVLLQVADGYEKEVKLRGTIKSALTYPVAVLGIALLSVFGMLLFVVPTFAKMFDSLGGQLPAPTKLLMALSNASKWLAPLFVVVMVIFTIWYRKNRFKTSVRSVVDPLRLKIPIFGKLFQKVALARFARNLGTMLKSGVPILQCLDIVGDATGNIVIERALKDVQDSVRNGESLTRPLAEHGIFPPMVVQMMAVGEDTGALDTMLAKIAEFYDEEVQSTTESLTALIEPLMIAVLGGIIGSMIVALYMPIFKLMDLVK